jgi:hypothetical protein
MIGAAELSDLAKALEKAAKAEDEEFIRTHHEAAMAEYKRLTEGIAGIYEVPAGAQTAGVKGEKNVILEFLPGED